MDMQNSARSFLNRTIPAKKLNELCTEYGIEVGEDATYKELLDKVILKRAKQGDEDSTEIAREFNIHE